MALKRLTLCVNCPANRNYKIEDFLPASKLFIPLVKIVSFGPLRKHNVWYLTVADKDTFDRILGNNLVINKDSENEVVCTVSAVLEPTALIKVHWAPPWMANMEIEKEISVLGKVLFFKDQMSNISELRHVKTGIKICRIECRDVETLPDFIHGLFLTVYGRSSLCFRCNIRGHISKDCDRRPCSSCKMFLKVQELENHVCDRSYAAVSKSKVQSIVQKEPNTEKMPDSPNSNAMDLENSDSDESPLDHKKIICSMPPIVENQHDCSARPQNKTPDIAEQQDLDQTDKPGSTESQASVNNTTPPSISPEVNEKLNWADEALIVDLESSNGNEDDLVCNSTSSTVMDMDNGLFMTPSRKRSASHQFPGDVKKAVLIATSSRFADLPHLLMLFIL